MFGLETLDVLIGLVSVYLSFGIACTAIVEAFAAWFSVRSGNLEKALKELLHGELATGKQFVDAFYEHPLVQALSQGADGRPSYIPPQVVGQVVEALVTAGGTKASLEAAVQALPGSLTTNRIKGLLDVFATQAGGKAADFRKGVEAHFEVVMDRASGWFKRYAQQVALTASAVLVIAANVDTVALVTSLASSPAARTKMVELAEQQVTKAQTQAGLASQQAANAKAPQEQAAGKDAVEQAKTQTEAAREALALAASNMTTAGLQIGWTRCPTWSEMPTKLAGLLVSILAVSLGAPFWFDVLQRFMQVRTTGTSPREAK